MRPVTPRGFRDVLFEEAAERAAISRAMSDAFLGFGFRFVETPALEEYRTLDAAAGASLEGTAFRMVDLDGSLLALRPEMTLPIARLAASRLASEPRPQRLCYAAEVFREQASLRGEARQFTQLGVELLGVNGASSDAEVVAVLVEALRAAGLPDFTVGVGTVAVLRALIHAAGGDVSWGGRVLAAAHARNLVELDRLSCESGIDERVGAALRRVVRIGGGREAIGECREVAGGVGCGGALDELEAMWELLEAAGAADAVRVDFGILRSFDYYTGFIVEAYAPGLGLPLGGGGRYDDVLAAFGAPMPAAGFALSLERVMIALAEQSVRVPLRGLDALVGGAAADVARASAMLRGAGWRVRAAVAKDAAGLAAEAVAAGAACWFVAGEATATLVRGGTLALAPLPEPPSLTGKEACDA
jgi:ATP phosphoribosyltransferase